MSENEMVKLAGCKVTVVRRQDGQVLVRWPAGNVEWVDEADLEEDVA